MNPTDAVARTPQREEALADLVEEITQAIEAGQPVDMSAYAARYPQFAEEIKRMIPTFLVLEDLGLSAVRSSGSVKSSSTPARSIGGNLGDFRLVREVGRGGMGVVYEAEQVSLGRRVALKVLPLAGVLDERQLTRFGNEARAAASLKHPNMVAVHAVGCERGVHYYAMDYIEGRTLAEVIAELRRESGAATGATAEATLDGPAHAQPLSAAAPFLRPPTPSPEAPTEAGPVGQAFQPDVGLERPTYSAAGTDRIGRSQASTQKPIGTKDFFGRVASWGIQAAEGLEHAHQTGIVHRDIKPSNLMVDASGHLWITDFGLAQVQTDAGITMTGDILGTLRYMSPEQASGRSRVTDHHTDIYSLGVTLYELLTLRPPFAGEDRQEILQQITSEDPAPPRHSNRAIPQDLETIVLKAMAKEPPARYATAQEMAEDLKRFVADEPIRARRPTLVRRAAKWTRRHRPLVWAAAAVAAVVTMTGGGVLWTSHSRTVQLERDAREHLAAVEAFLRAADYPKAERELAEVRGHIEAAGYHRGLIRDRMDALAEQLADKNQAIQRFEQFQKLRERIHSETYAVNPDILTRAQEHCRTALEQFGVFGADSWKRQPAFRNLDSERQAILEEGVVELLFVWARLEVGKGEVQSEAERKAGHRRVIETLGRIETFHAPIPAIQLWIADSWEVLGEEKAEEEAHARAEAVHPATATDHLILGVYHARHGRLEDALASYWQALARQPDHYLSLLAAGVVLGDLKRHEAAEAMLSGAIAMKPRTPLAYVKRGASRLEQGKKTLAQADFQHARKLDADLVRDLTRRATAYTKNQEYSMALADWTDAIRLDPNSGPAFAERGYVQYYKGDLDAALADKNEAIQLDPNNASNYAARSTLYRGKGLTDKALADCNEAIRLDPNGAFGYWTRGSVYTDRGEWEKALADFNEAARLSPNQPRVFASRGGFHQVRGEREQASADFSEAIRLDPGYFLAYHGRAQLYRDAGEFDKALADYNEAIRLRPKVGWLYARRADTYRAKGDSDKALADYDQALQVDPNEPGVLCDRGVHHRSRGERDAAIADFNEAIRLEPKQIRSFVQRAELYRDNGEFDKALADRSEVVRLKPNDASAYLRRAEAFTAVGEFDKAIADYTDALRLAPEGPSAIDAEHKRAECANLRLFDKTLAAQAQATLSRAMKLYFEEHKLAEAMLQFDEAIKTSGELLTKLPDAPVGSPDRPPCNVLARCLAWRAHVVRVEKNDADQAIADCPEAIRSDPQCAVAYRHRGVAYSVKGDSDKAMADFDAAVSLDPTDRWNLSDRAAEATKRKEFDKAQADVDQMIRLNPRDGGAYASRGQGHLARGDFEKAAVDYDQAAEVGNMSWHHYKRRAVAHFELKHYDKALESIAKAVELNPRDFTNLDWIDPSEVAKCPDERLGKGLLELADKTIEKNSSEAGAYAKRARLYAAFGQHEKAITDITEAIRLDPKSADAYSSRAWMHRGRGDLDKALSDLDEAIRIAPQSAWFRTERARTLGAKGDLDKALADFGKAIELEPNNVAVWTGRARFYLDQKQWAEAIADFEKALELQPAKAGECNNLAWYLATCPDPRVRKADRAVELATKATQLAPNEGVYWNTLGVAQYRAGDYKAAIDALTKAMELRSGGDAYDWFFLAMGHCQLKNPEEARQWYDKAVEWMQKNKPDDEELGRFRTEAAELLGIPEKPPAERPSPETAPPEKESQTKPEPEKS